MPIALCECARSLHAADARLKNFGEDAVWTAPTNIGTPAQKLQLLVDTGSPVLWAFSDKCDLCGTGSFDPSKSSTFVNSTKRIEYAYGTGRTSVNGFAVKDTVGIGSTSTPGVDWALIDEEWLMRLGDVSAGLSGWSWPVTTHGGFALPVPYIQATKKQWSDPTFGIYLNRDSKIAQEAGVASKGKGAITISGVDSQYFEGDLTWTERRVLSDSFVFGWGIDFPSFTINGRKHTLAAGAGAVLDSGTSLIYGPPDDVAAFYEGYAGANANGYGSWSVPCDNFDNKVSFHFAGKDWPIEPVDLIWGEGTQCLGSVVASAGLKADGHWLVGGAFLKNVYTAHRYDPPGVGFAPLKAGL